MSKMLTRVAPRLAALALLPLVLAGCFRIDLAINVNDDGSGAMTMLVAFDESLMSLMQGLSDDSGGADDVDPLEMLGGIDPADLPPGVTVEPYTEDDFVGARITFPFAATDDVAAALDEAFAASGESGPLADASGLPLEGLILRKDDDDGWHFEAGVGAPMADQEGVDPSMAALLLEDASFTVRLRLPGEVVETNADEQSSDGELIWHIDPAGDERTLLARTQPASGGMRTLLIGGAALATILVVVGLGYWVRRRAAASGTGAGLPPQAGEPPITGGS